MSSNGRVPGRRVRLLAGPSLARTLMLLVFVLLAAARVLDAPSVSAGSQVSRQELRQHHQQSTEPALTSLSVTAGGQTQPLSPSLNSTVKYYTVVVSDAVTQITVAAGAGSGDNVAFQETDGTALDDADPNTSGHQLDIPPAGKRVNIIVTRTATGGSTTYGLLVIREGPTAPDTIALMALYNSANGEMWTQKTNWATAEPISTWHGIEMTDAYGRVVELVLEENGLSGTIPDLSNLASLETLYLSRNELTGSIPALSALTNLRILGLSQNRLTGSIPALNSLTGLEELYLWGNELSGRIPDLSALTSLYYLSLGGNQFTESIPDLSRLTKLRYLYLWGNELSGTIPDLSAFTELEYVSLRDNKLRGTIADLSALTNLKSLSLYGNKLSGPIPNLNAPTTLEYLYLGDNELTGPIPASLNAHTSLLELSLWGNGLTGDVPDLSALTSLTVLHLGDNELDGEIPASLNALTSLLELSLWGNKLTGEIPDLSSLTSMLELDLHDNQLTGPVPTWLNDFTSMQGLWLNDNQLTGTIPNLRGLQALLHLELGNNELDGSIPASVGTLGALQNLILNDNQLTGPIPDLSGINSLAYVDLRGNLLSGPIPASLGQITGLQELYLHDNQLTGEIPAVLADLTSLRAARFANNALTGCVPHGLRYLLAPPDEEPLQPAHDFFAVDANGDGDTDDEDDVPQLDLPFCMLSALWFDFSSLDPAFAPGTTAYTVEITDSSATVTVNQNEPTDEVSIKKGGISYEVGEAVPLDVGNNQFTIEVTPSDARLVPQIYTVDAYYDGTEDSDREALIALYNSAGGSGWTDSTNWNTVADVDQWFGVFTNNDGRVNAINLSRSELSGNNPSGNNLSGTLPAELANLTNLEELDLRHNQLSGAIPPELRRLSLLHTLDLSENTMRGGIPPELGEIEPLVYLDLSANDFSGTIPIELGTLHALLTLRLSGNQLNGPIPAELGDLSSLWDLRLNDNQLSGTIPPELGNPRSLSYLSLESNRLSGSIPESLGNIGLQYVRFADNAFTGCVPHGLRQFLNKSGLYLPEDPDTLLPAHDFTWDFEPDGNLTGPDDITGLTLPFCGLSELRLVGLTLEPAFAGGVEAYTAAALFAEDSVRVTATLHPAVVSADELSITKGGAIYQSGDAVPLEIGPNLIDFVVTATDGTTTPFTYTRIHRSKHDGAGCRASGESGGSAGVRRAVPERAGAARGR